MEKPTQKISIDVIKNSTEIKCEFCEHDTFEEVLKLRKISKIITGSSKDTLIPIPVFACKKCGNINKDFDITNLNT